MDTGKELDWNNPEELDKAAKIAEKRGDYQFRAFVIQKRDEVLKKQGHEIVLDPDGQASRKCTCGGEVIDVVGGGEDGIPEHLAGVQCLRCNAKSDAVPHEAY